MKMKMKHHLVSLEFPPLPIPPSPYAPTGGDRLPGRAAATGLIFVSPGNVNFFVTNLGRPRQLWAGGEIEDGELGGKT